MSACVKYIFLILIAPNLMAAIDTRSEFMTLKKETELRLKEVEDRLVHIQVRTNSLRGFQRRMLINEIEEIDLLKAKLVERLDSPYEMPDQEWLRLKNQIKTLISQIEVQLNDLVNQQGGYNGHFYQFR